MIKLPKDLRGGTFNRALQVTANGFDVDAVLPAVFFRVVSEGQERGRHPNDPTQIQSFVDRLAQHRDVQGFESLEGGRLLNRLVRTSLVEIGRQGIRRNVEQISGIAGHTFLSFKSGIPDDGSRLRSVDRVVYQMMREQVGSDTRLRALFEEVFGQGLSIQGGRIPDGSYDGATPLDTLTRLSIAFLDGFQPTPARPAVSKERHEACPTLAIAMASDLRAYMLGYHRSMPTEALAYHFRALINFELFTYTMKLFYAIPELIAQPDRLPAAMSAGVASSPPEVYIDFTGTSRGLSSDMAAYGVRRDVEAISRYLVGVLTLRHLDRYVQRFRNDRRVGQIVNDALAQDDGGPGYLQALLRLRGHSAIATKLDAAAEYDEQLIRDENTPADHEGKADPPEWKMIDEIASPGESSLERLVLLLAEGQRSKGTQNTVKWYWSIGGLTKPHGIMSGLLRHRQSWRYAPSNDLLATWVQLAAVAQGDGNDGRPDIPESVSLRGFLDWLERRFGILVDRPLAEFRGAEYVAAAQENLQAMLRRLRQMGIFRDLSDDVTTLRLYPPYSRTNEETVTR